MNESTDGPEQLPETAPSGNLAGDCADAALLEVEPEFPVFAAWLDEELEKLVARWSHLAAPNASRAGRNISHVIPRQSR